MVDCKPFAGPKKGFIANSFSADSGQTWSSLKATNLPNPNSGIEAVTLFDGRHLLIYNHLGSGTNGWGRRGMLNLAISEDGLNWRKAAVLEKQQGAEFSYPANHPINRWKSSHYLHLETANE